MQEATIVYKNKGYNRFLVEARIKQNLTRKEAAKKLGISYIYLVRIEKGYSIVHEKYQEKFITVYDLEKDFFENDLCYPTAVNFDKYKEIKVLSKAYKFYLSRVFKIISLILTLGFLAQCIIGITNLPILKGNTTSFFNESSINTYNYVLKNGETPTSTDEDSEFANAINDSKLFIKLNGNNNERFDEVKLTYYLKERNLPYSFTSGEYSDNSDYLIKIEQRYSGNNSTRFHCLIHDKAAPDKLKARVTCDVNKEDLSNYKFNFVVINNCTDELITRLGDNDPLYKTYSSLFETYSIQFDNDLVKLFNEKLSPVETSYIHYSQDMNSGMTSFSSYRFTMWSLVIWGLVLAVIFGVLFVFSFILKNKFEKKQAAIFNDIEQTDYSNVKINEELVPAPKNKGFNLRMHEFEIRVIALVFLFMASMVTFFTFSESLHLYTPIIQDGGSFRTLISNLDILAVLLLYFLKLDTYQNKKKVAAFSWFLFITGVLYYLLIVALYFIIEGLNRSGSILTSLLNLFPGNLLWAVLTFNAFTIFLFSKVNFKKPSKTKYYLFRLCSLIPLSYLIVSSVFSIGITGFGWDVHYLVSSLLFFKAPYITVFALFYSLFVFIYRRYTVKKYGEENALLYQSGNKYNLIRNIAACSIVLILGLIDLIFLWVYPDNKFGFGVNYIILIAIPIILFYHPHIGKRNSAWDICYYALYCYVYIAGILAIVIRVIMFLTTI